MNCLQEHFEQKEFKDRYPKCYNEVEKFTNMESKVLQKKNLNIFYILI